MSLFWEQLLDLVAERSVVPIVGTELLTVGHEGRTQHLYPLLARRLGEYLEIPTDDLPAGEELNAIACRFIDQRQDVQDLYPALKRVMPSEEELEIPEPLLQLARIRHFDLFVTTTFDPLLVRALDQVRFGGKSKTEVRTYGINDAEDIPDNLGALDTPVVYHLFGKLSAMPNFALTQEDLLEFVHSLQSAEHKRPELLLDALKSNNLLLLGSNLDDWMLRSFLRFAKHQRLLEIRGSTNYLADAKAQADDRLGAFLRYFSTRTKVYQNGGGIDFVGELYRRWSERHPEEEPVAASETAEETESKPAFMEPGSVFLSYASEDRAAARALKETLEAAGIDVFFDRDQLRAGDDWDAKLVRSIAECSLFVPVISSASLSTGRRYFRAEWDRALEEARKVAASERYLLPVVIDDTKEDAPELPGKFREIQWEAAPEGRPTPEFVTEVRDLFRRFHKEGSGA